MTQVRYATPREFLEVARHEWSRRHAWKNRRAAVRATWWWLARRYAYELCQDCGRPVGRSIGDTYWLTSDEAWLRVHGSEGGTVCPRCFTLAADRIGVNVHWLAVLLPQPDGPPRSEAVQLLTPEQQTHPEPLLRAVADAIEAECPDGKTYSAMVIADVALGAVRKFVPQPDTEWREAVELLSDALGVAMLTLQDFVDGKGPRGHALLPLLLLADAAADKRDEVLAPRNDPTSDPTGVENASADGGSGC